MGIQKWPFWLCKASVGKKWPFGRGPKKGTFRAQNIFWMVWAFFSRNFGLERVFSRKTGKKLKIDLLGPTFGDPGPGLRPPKVGLRRSILGQIPVFREKTLSRPKFREKNAQTIKKMFWAHLASLGPHRLRSRFGPIFGKMEKWPFWGCSKTAVRWAFELKIERGALPCPKELPRSIFSSNAHQTGELWTSKNGHFGPHRG